MSTWNRNRFSVFTSDEKDVLGLIEELGKEVNNNLDILNNKTDLTGDHKGSWQGLSKPTLSDEGMRATVEKHITEIADLKNTIYKNNVDISLLPNYDKNDISIVLNSIVFEENVRYFLNDGDVESKQMVNIELPRGCKLEIHGTITAWKSFMEIRLSLKGSSLYIDTLLTKQNLKCEKGIHIKRGAECDININKIIGFDKCLLLQPTRKPINDDYNNSDWLQYNKINFFGIQGDIAIDISCLFKETWINENTFNGGGLGGRLNVYMHKDYVEDVIQSRINNNKFYNLGVQSTEECIKIADYSGEQNYFYNLRMQEQEWSKETLNINDKGTLNYFECLCSVPFESIKLGNKSEYHGLLQTKEWDTYTNSFPIVGYGAYGDENKTKRTIVKKVPTNVSVTFSGGEFKLYTCAEVVRCSMNSGETGNIRLQPSVFFNSNNFMISKVGYSNSTVNIFTPTGKKLTLTDNGLYFITLTNDLDYFEVHKLSNADALNPS